MTPEELNKRRKEKIESYTVQILLDAEKGIWQDIIMEIHNLSIAIREAKKVVDNPQRYKALDVRIIKGVCSDLEEYSYPHRDNNGCLV